MKNPTPTEPISDRDLWQQYRQSGDEDAVRQLLARHWAWVRRFCWVQLGNEQDADDAAQSVFLILVDPENKIVDTENLTSWLHTVARNVCSNVSRSSRRRNHHEHLAGQQQQTSYDSVSDDAMEDLQKAEKYLPECLAKLKTVYQEVIIRHYLHAQPQTKIASELGLTEGAVQKRIGRGIEQLRTLMRRRGVAFSPAIFIVIGAPSQIAPSAETMTSVLQVLQQGFAGGSRSAEIARQTVSRSFWSGMSKGISAAVLILGIAGATWYGFTVSNTSENPPVIANNHIKVVRTQAVVQLDVEGKNCAAISSGTEFPPGSILQTDVTGEVELVLPGETQVILRESGRLINTDGRLNLQQGALQVQTSKDDSINVGTSRCRVSVTGQVWILSTEAFCRVDVVNGSAKVTDISSQNHWDLKSGQAKTFGANCPKDIIAAASEELSPRFGGLFYRWVADRYATGRNVLSDGPGAKVRSEEIPITTKGLAIIRTTGTGLQSSLGLYEKIPAIVLQCPNTDKVEETLRFPMEINPRNCATVELSCSYTLKFGINFTGQSAPWILLVNSPWKQKDIPDLKDIFHSIIPSHVTFSCVTVGVTPSGQMVWEQSYQKNNTSDWMKPLLLIGERDAFFEMVIFSGGNLYLQRIVFGETDVRMLQTKGKTL